MPPLFSAFNSTPSHTRRPARAQGGVRPRWRHAVLGSVLGLVMAVLIWAPARWLAWGIAQATQGQMQWLDTRGTVWEGSAQLSLTGGADSRDALALPGRLHWTVTPAWTGLRLTLQADCCMAQAAHWKVQLGAATLALEVNDHPSQWPAALLTGLGAPWNTLQPDGLLQLRTQGLRLHWAQGRLQMRGLVDLNVQNLSSRLSPIKPMGSYRIALTGTPEGTPTPGLQLDTLEGPLRLSGQGQWVGQRLRFTGEASAQEGSEAALSNLLNIIGRRQGARSLISLG